MRRSTGQHGEGRSASSAEDPATAFLAAQTRVLQRYGVEAEARFIHVPAIDGTAQVLIAGEGPPLPMVIGGAVPGAFWIPLMAKLPGRTLYVIELPGFGLTDPVPLHHSTLRRTAVSFLAGVLDTLDVGPTQFVTQSMGSLWTTWLAWDQPERVTARCMIGCPGMFLGTSASLPFRLVSVPGLGRLLMSLQEPSAKGAEKVMRMVGEDPSGLDELRDLLVAAQRIPAYTQALVHLSRAVMSWTLPRPEIVVTADQLRRVHHPVQLIWGERDTFGPPEAGRRIADLIPDAEFHLVPGGHAPWFHHAELVAGLTQEFLLGHHREPPSAAG